jgi:cytochrome c-type biogenesis protein CcmH
VIWLVFALLTVAAVVGAAWPLLVRAPAGARSQSEAEFHRAQLAEIDRDVERGVLPQAEAAAARAEAGRRLISATAGSSEDLVERGGGRRRFAAAIVMAAVIMAVGTGVYGQFGSPGLPDAPLAARQLAPAIDAVQAALTHVEAQAAADPDNLKAWSALAPVYIRLGRYGDAVNAFRQVLRLRGDDAETDADLGEAEVMAAGGEVTAEARRDFDKALALEPGMPMARFYIALQAEQAGDSATAVAAYEGLIPDTQDRPHWTQIIQTRLSALKGESPSASSPSTAAQADDSPQDMIHAMVSRLATRLAQQGGNADEWMRLVRAYTVLQQTDKAKDALASAKKALSADTSALASLDTLAKELGLAQP